MKVLCNTEFVHSNTKVYMSGVAYEITKEQAGVLQALEVKGKPIGALSFFSPIDEDAVEFYKGLKGAKAEQPEKSESGTAGSK